MWTLIGLLRDYLSWSDWSRVCVALRLMPDRFGSYRSLVDMYNQKSSNNGSLSEGEQQTPIDTNIEEATVPMGAFLLGNKHLTIPVPWREETSRNWVVIDSEEAADMLDYFFQGRIILESIHCVLRLPQSNLRRFISSLMNVLKHNADTLKLIAISCEHGLADLRAQDCMTKITTEPQTEGNNIPNKMKSLQHEQPTMLGNCLIDFSATKPPLQFPQLTCLHLTVPYKWSPEIQLSAIESIYVNCLGEDRLLRWLNNGEQGYDLREVYLGQMTQLYNLFQSACLTVEEISINGDVRIRQEADLFSHQHLFYPKLKSLHLGWTCEAELKSLYTSLQPSVLPVSEILDSPQQSHVSMAKARTVAKLPDNLGLSSSIVRLPPRLPALAKLSFNGPVRMGLSDLHLDIYAAVNPRSRAGIHLQYGLYTATLHGVIRFRMAFPEHPIFAVFRDPFTRLHHLIMRGVNDSAYLRTSIDWPGVLRTRQLPIATILKYHYICVETSTREKFTTTQRLCMRLRPRPQSLIDGRTSWTDSAYNGNYFTGYDFSTAEDAYPRHSVELETTSASVPASVCYRPEIIVPPRVGPDMTGRDLFALEMWQLAALSLRDCAPHGCVYDIWDELTEIHCFYDTLVKTYIDVRVRDEDLNFTSVLPWWKQCRQRSCLEQLVLGRKKI